MADPSGHPALKREPTVHDVQDYIAATVRYRGFSNTVQDSFLMLTEEVGELAKELRKQSGIGMATDSTQTTLNHEVADVFWMLVCVCNDLGIDLEQALRAKEEKNKQRVWR